ncbi:hypothetical protein SS50377_20798 [Spironucleus salmonicida]|uniref:Uncharacterized protein n=1 Tax=Spironucleus salmonicida TaxID=348837 RepID=V6M1L9_9EUKA|nr:hypothetical protein SS50377_20798 [Spironucleus salmonicida]|eukprot:EST47094.1 Hypothetical protein SS50377_12800 [Spironucleus salmonicida]
MKCCQQDQAGILTAIQETLNEDFDELTAETHLSSQIFAEITKIQAENSRLKQNFTKTIAFLKDTDSTSLKGDIQKVIDFQRLRNAQLRKQLKGLRKCDPNGQLPVLIKQLNVQPLMLEKRQLRNPEIGRGLPGLLRLKSIQNDIMFVRAQIAHESARDAPIGKGKYAKNELLGIENQFVSVFQNIQSYPILERISELKMCENELKEEKLALIDAIFEKIEETEKLVDPQQQLQLGAVEATFNKILILGPQALIGKQELTQIQREIDIFTKIDELGVENQILNEQISFHHAPAVRILARHALEKSTKTQLAKIQKEIVSLNCAKNELQGVTNQPELIEEIAGFLNNESQTQSEHFKEEVEKICSGVGQMGIRGDLVKKYKKQCLILK